MLVVLSQGTKKKVCFSTRKQNPGSDSQMVVLTEGPDGIDFTSATMGKLNPNEDERSQQRIYSGNPFLPPPFSF